MKTQKLASNQKTLIIDDRSLIGFITKVQEYNQTTKEIVVNEKNIDYWC